MALSRPPARARKSPPSLRKYVDAPDPVLVAAQIAQRTGVADGPFFDRHWHEHLQLMHFTKGQALLHCQSGVIEMGAGDVILLNSRELHYAELVGESLDFSFIKVDPRCLEISRAAPGNPLSTMPKLTRFKNRIVPSHPILRWLRRILNEHRRQERGFELAIRGSLQLLYAELLRHHVDWALSSDEQETYCHHEARMHSALCWMEANLATPVRIAQLAKKAGLSPEHFSRLFKSFVGTTPREHLIHLRMQRAKDLLLNGTLGIGEVAFSVGFQDSNYFSRQFRQFTGEAPSAYRRDAARRP